MQKTVKVFIPLYLAGKLMFIALRGIELSGKPTEIAVN